MKKFNFVKISRFAPAFIFVLGVAFSFSSIAQTESDAQNNADMTPLTKKELDDINHQPIAKSANAKDRVQGVEKRRLSYELKEDDGTHIQEYRDGNKPVEIQVDSSFGTHYEMSTPANDQTPVIRDQTINRVPSIRMPF